MAGPGVAEILNKSGKLTGHVEPVTGVLFEGIEVLPTPGHTPSHHSLRFDCDGLSVIADGDAIATRDFFRDRQNFYNAADPKQGVATMNKIAELADLIIPGHDNYFVTGSSSRLEALFPQNKVPSKLEANAEKLWSRKKWKEPAANRLRTHVQFPALGYEITAAWFHPIVVWFADARTPSEQQRVWL